MNQIDNSHFLRYLETLRYETYVTESGTRVIKPVTVVAPLYLPLGLLGRIGNFLAFCEDIELSTLPLAKLVRIQLWRSP